MEVTEFSDYLIGKSGVCGECQIWFVLQFGELGHDGSGAGERLGAGGEIRSNP